MNGRGRFFLMGLLALVCQLPWSRAEAQTVEYIHTDALGTPIAVTDANRVVIERSEYEPYGKLLNRPLTDGPGFTGHVQDAATGMTYMQQRYYDPAIGRFLSVDPVTANSGTGANFNRYWYANNNPYRFTDPDGRLGMDWLGGPCDLRPCSRGPSGIRSIGPIGDISSQGGGDSKKKSSRRNPATNSVKRNEYDGSKEDGEKKQALELVGVLDSLEAKAAADDALKAAKDSGLPGLHNGPADAYRHCRWSCDMARAIGAKNAKLVGDNHEAWGGGPAGETQMDLHNNRAGRIFSPLSPTCDASCMRGVQREILILTPVEE